jgi:hypothetical protein
MTAHWGVADPAAVQGDAQKGAAFRKALAEALGMSTHRAVFAEGLGSMPLAAAVIGSGSWRNG